MFEFFYIYSHFIFLGYAFNNSIASVFGFFDKLYQSILPKFAFNNSIALGLHDNQPQSIFLGFAFKNLLHFGFRDKVLQFILYVGTQSQNIFSWK